MEEMLWSGSLPQGSLAAALPALFFWNAAAFLVMGWDKRQAKTHGWRVPEKTLFFMAFTLGGPGILGGMLAFRHKTRHFSFRMGIPAAIILDCVLIWLVFFKLLV